MTPALRLPRGGFRAAAARCHDGTFNIVVRRNGFEAFANVPAEARTATIARLKHTVFETITAAARRRRRT